jgi:hypothetical protein
MRAVLAFLAMPALFLLASAGVVGVTLRVTRQTGVAALGAAALLLGTGPLWLGTLLGWLLVLAPGRAPSWYLTVLVGVAGVVFLCGIGGLESLARSIGESWRGRRPISPWVGPLVVAGLLIQSLVIVLAVTQPFVGSDPLEYATVARLFGRSASQNNYPFEIADPETGYFWLSTHPLAHVNLLTLAYWIQGTDLNLGAGRTVAPWFYLSIAAAVAGALVKHGRTVSTVGWCLASLAPGLVMVCLEAHIDPALLSAAAAALYWSAGGLRALTTTGALIQGGLVGLVLNAHSLGLLLAPICILGRAVIQRDTASRAVTHTIIVALVAALVGGWQYWDNWHTVGRLIGNSALDLTGTGFQQAVWTAVDRGLDTWFGRLTGGLLRPWLAPLFFGLIPWIALAGIVRTWRQWPSTPDTLLAALGFLAMVGLGVAAVVTGTITPIQNYRYQLFLIPTGIVLAAPIVAEWIVVRPMRAAATIIVSLAMAFAVPVGVEVKQLLRGDHARLTEPRGLAIYRVLSHIECCVHPSERVLVFRPAEPGFYSSRQYLYSDDPRVAPVFDAESPEEAVRRLRILGVTIMLDPGLNGYSQIERTQIGPLMNRVDLVEELFAEGSVRLIRLKAGNVR